MEWDRLDTYREGVCFISLFSLKALPFMVQLMEQLQVCQLCDAANSLLLGKVGFFVCFSLSKKKNDSSLDLLFHSLFKCPVCLYTVLYMLKADIKESLAFDHFIVPKVCVLKSK